MKILISYYSQTGNTEKIAKAILEEVEDEHEARLSKISEIKAENLSDFDLVFLGAPCHDSDLARPLKKLLEALPQSPKFKLAGFFTHATYTPGSGPRSEELYEEWAGRCHRTFETTCQEKQIKFLGYFNCMGAPSPPIAEFIHSQIIKDEDEWRAYLPKIQTHPTKEDLRRARVFAREALRACE
jgi:flavodoxin